MNAAPGFRAGFSAVFGGIGFLLRTPRALPYATVPAAILTSLALTLSGLALFQVQPLLAGWVGTPSSWWGRLGTEFVSWAGALITAAFGILLALALTPSLSGPALERIVALQERELGSPPRPDLGFFDQIWCGLRAQVAPFVIAAPFIGALTAIELAFAPAVGVTVPLRFVIAAFALAWNLFDYPLTLRGIPVRQRMYLVNEHKSALFGFGLSFALLFWIPCVGILLLPVGVAAATKLLWRIAEHEPGLMVRF